MIFKNRLGGHTNSYHTYGLEEALEGIAAAGFHFVELTAVRGWTEHVPLAADGMTLGKIQRLLHKLNLVPVSLSGHSDLTTQSGLADGLLAVDLCARMGIDILNTAIGGHYSEEEDESAFMNNIHILADAAAKHNILVGIEIHGVITNTAERSIPVIRQINRPNVLINYDTANVEFWGGADAESDIPMAKGYLGHCHLKDTVGGYRNWNFPAVGEGHINWKNVLGLFQQIGYQGPFTVEIEFSGEPWPALAEVNRSMKKSYETLRGLGLS